ncbi:signal peptidase I [bacterium]|nr:signal peptidase I [bacterium]
MENLENENQVGFFRSSLSFILEILKTVIISLAIILPIRYFLIQPFMVDGASMEPTFYDNEYLIVDEISYRLNEPQRGEIIVFKNPENESQYFIKRIIALPNEIVRFKNGDVYIKKNTSKRFVKLNEDYLPTDLKTNSRNEEIIVDSNEYLVLGDNRGNSRDSRYFGAIGENNIIGRVWIRGFPFNRINIFNSNDYEFEFEGNNK